MGAAADEFDLDFTVHFANAAVQSEKLPPAVEGPPAVKPASAKAPPVAKEAAAEKVVLDPDFKIGTSKLEAEGFHVAIARRNFAAGDAVPGNKVMFVEDEPVTNAVLKKVLTTDGFEAHGAFDAAGLGALLKKHGLPDVVLLDVELPNVSGLQILSRIRKHPKMRAIPVLMVTSRAEMSDVVRGLSLGANGYLSKPVAVESLRSILRQILGRLPVK
jgi:CheY-like chemotaxis protein